jgi:hypothetical protein
MIGKTLYLPGFSHLLAGSRPQAQKLKQQANSLDGLAALVGRFIPPEIFTPEAGRRRRVFTPWITFVAFLGQVLSRGSACREAVRRVQAWAVASGREVPDENTSGYCQARERLSVPTLVAAHEQLGQWFEQHRGAPWCGREVKVVDGTGLSMPDTADNRRRWPYAGGQKPGCGFPTAKLVGLFCLATGRLVRFAIESWHSHEVPLARQLISWIQPGEVVLADRGFSGWGFMALLQRKGVDVVMRLHQARLVKGRKMAWKRPQRKEGWTQSLWAELPEELTVRLVRLRVSVPGFRTHQVVLVTTLLDEAAYPDSAIAELYRRRWAVELFFRDIKTVLGMDVLRCCSPELIEKELWMQVFGYNLVRALILEAAWSYSVPVDRLSFKGTVDALRQWTPLLAPTVFAAKAARQELLRIIAADQVPLRPSRSEPRVRKRRRKDYQLMTKPRRQMLVSPSRSRK